MPTPTPISYFHPYIMIQYNDTKVCVIMKKRIFLRLESRSSCLFSLSTLSCGGGSTSAFHSENCQKSANIKLIRP